jgi:hypothetical protein
VYFDFSNAFDTDPDNILVRKVTNFGLTSGYVNRFHSYLTNSQSSIICKSGILDCVDRLYFNKITTFRKLDLLPSSGKKGKT